MDPNIFRKEDADSCLVVEKSWNDIIDKPDFFDELVQRLVLMTKGAEDYPDLLMKSTTFRVVKEAINDILLVPLQKQLDITNINVERTPNSILADAFWDEIIKPNELWDGIKEAIEKSYAMKQQIEKGEHTALTDSSTLQDVKNTMNDTVIKPLLGIEDDE